MRFLRLGAFFTALALLLFGLLDTELISLYLSDAGSVGDISLALKYGKEYLAIMMIGLIPFAIGQTYINTIRETGQTLIPMIASAAAVFTNLILDYVLIFGIAGIPAMGVEGAAIATVIARFIECLIVIVWTHTHTDKNLYIVGAYRGLGIPRSILTDIFKKGTPLMLNEMLWASGMAVISQCYAARGLEVVAAQNISSTISNLFNIVYIQLGGCISIVVGQLRNELRRMLEMARQNVDASFKAVLERDVAHLERVERRERYIDYLNKEISRYISHLITIETNERGSAIVSSFFSIAGNIERIGDHADNLAGYTRLLAEKDITLSQFAQEEVRQMLDITLRAVSALLSSEAGDPNWLAQVAQLEQKIDDMTSDFRRDQLVRMRDGVCSDEACILYSELLTDFERIGDHALNIAQELTKARTAL